MDNGSITYRIRLFNNSADADYIEALNIYGDCTPLSVKTDTSDITYWLDRYNKKFNDKFLIFGLYEEDIIVGFSQLVYFSKSKLVMIDYMAIDEKRRANSAFYMFTDLIRSELNKLKLDINFIVTEIEYDSSNKKPTENGIALIRLLKLSGFGVLKAEYFQPRLGRNMETAPCAVLMIDVKNPMDSITKDSYLNIVNTIYFDHYLRWYTPILSKDEIVLYKKELEELSAKINTSLSSKSRIEINGYKTIFENQARVDIDKKGLKFGVFSFLIILVVTACIMGIIKYFGASTVEVILCLLVSAAIYFLLNSMYTGNGMKEFDKLKSIIKLFGKNK